MNARVSLGWLTAAGFWLATAGAAEPRSASVDADFLEFLGTFEAQDEGIDEYLATQVVSQESPKPVAPAPSAAKEVSK